nr:clusterin-associated protein 1-like isoform X2 [Procambarus clarkii]
MVSLENFSLPNFQLVSEILTWAMTTVDADHDATFNIDSEQDRVFMVRMAALFFYNKLGVCLNTQKLYGADKLAARELLKITSCLYKAAESALQPREDSEELLQAVNSNLAVVSVKELREVRQLASNIIMDAASLCDSLKQQADNKIKWLTALDQAFDLDFLEASVISALHALACTVAEIKEATESLEKQGKEIMEKIQKKRESLTRNEKRMEALMKIKPAWQTEFDQEESELRTVWDDYITKHKSLAYLEEELKQLEKQQLNHIHQQLDMTARSREAAMTEFSVSGVAKSSVNDIIRTSHQVLGNMTGENVESSDESDTVDSLLIDSGSEDDSLTLMSAAGRAGPVLQQGLVYAGSLKTASASTQQLEHTSLPLERVSASHSYTRPPSARPKSSQKRMGGSSLTTWTSVKGSGRVSPLSVSEDNSDDAF